MKRREFIIKALQELNRRLKYFNIKNSYVRDLADKEKNYYKLKRKFRKIINNEYKSKKTQGNKEFSNIVWVCWLQGIKNSPDLVRACNNSLKMYFKNKKIIILTNNNYLDYVKIPDYIIKKYKKGYISFAHFSDLLRIELLTTYGGYWIDSTILMTSEQNIFNEKKTPLFVYKNIILDKKSDFSIVASNWLIYSCKDNIILNFTKKLLYEYWRVYSYAIDYNIFHLFFKIATEVYTDEWSMVPSYSNIPPHILQFELKNKFNDKRFNSIKEMSCFHKLDHRISTIDKDSNYYHIIKTYLGERK